MANHLSYEVLNRLLDGRASALEEVRGQRHLARCGRCRSEREWLQRIRNFPLRSVDDDSHEPPEGASRPRAFIDAYWLGHSA
jgi:hypothetical protein